MINSPNILIVDDTPSAQATLKAYLFGQSYNFVFASDAVEAFEKIVELPPDVILLDVMMPGVDGFNVCRSLKSDTKWQHIPVVLVTALDGQEEMVKGLDAGADDFLTKPISGLELRARVRSMLRIKHQYDVLDKKQQELEASLHLNQKFSEAMGQHLETLEVLHQTGLRSIEDNLSMDAVLNLILLTALDLIPEASGCITHLLTDDGQQLLPVVFPAEEKTKHVYPSVGIEGIIKRVMETRQPLHIPDLITTPHHLHPQLPEFRALIVAPLMDDQQALGTLSLYSAESHAFDANHSYVLSLLANQAAVTISNARFIEARVRTQEQEKQVIRSLFQRYVSPAVVERLVDGKETLTLGGQRQEVSILFADIRGFSTFSENLSPEVLVIVLNEYLALAVEAILAQEGTLDKFMGDAVMAIFNAPLPQSNHTLRAVYSALTMQQAITDYNKKASDLERLSFGIGIHVGKAVAGNIGTPQQMNYTAIGDTVNLAKRLQEKAKGGQIILSQAAYKTVKEVVTVEDLGVVTVKGRAATERIYLLSGLN